MLLTEKFSNTKKNMANNKKIILKYDDQTVGRQHLLMVASVISCLLAIMSTLFIANRYYDYLLISLYIVMAILSLISPMIQRIRLLLTAAIILFILVIVKLYVSVELIRKYLDIRHDCFINYHDNCFDKNWGLTMLNTMNGWALMVISTIIDTINFISLMTILFNWYKLYK